ncbi:energy transducer TonB [Helicobacter sp. UBA3407]|uniref:energy transducer TonB n=1 Tax=Helicobacter TaxID=209 RepID=UPI0026163A45|nr:energy transducer TonB [Helicobacter sp. UBA3407]
MKRNNFLALFLSLAIHALLLLLFLWESHLSDLYHPPRLGTQEGERVSLKHFRFSQGGEGQSREQAPAPQARSESTPRMQESPKAKVEKPKKPKPQTNQSKSAQSKPATKQISKALSESLAQSLARPQTQSTQNHQNASGAVGAPHPPSIYDFGKDMSNQEVKDLYGEEFGSLDAEQRKFIKDNLSGIGRITQRYLKYPTIAGKMGQQGDNIVEFYLYPNGDISDLKLLTPSGFTLLDDNSVHTIKIAYKDYPYPSVKTKIRIRVMYRIW